MAAAATRTRALTRVKFEHITYNPTIYTLSNGVYATMAGSGALDPGIATREQPQQPA
jgi:hypothetical protein